jgi:CDP-glucose 4,6-dehydratase
VYGGGDLNWSRIVPETIQAGIRGVRPVIRSDGSYVRDYIYVKDVSSAYLHLAECMHDPLVQGAAFNVSPEHAVSVLDLVGRIQRLMGCEHLTPDVQNTAEGEIRSQYLDASKARRLLGWRPRFTLDEGLAETIAWYRTYLRPDADGDDTPAQPKDGELSWSGR